MTGAFGWIKHNVDLGTRHGVNAFSDAQHAYRGPTSPPTTAPPPSAAASPRSRTPTPKATPPSPPPPAAIIRTLPPPTALHTLVSTAANVLIVVLDRTGSMGDWRDEIRKRCALLFVDAAKYLGTQDLEILFIGHGDTRTDSHAIQVARFGNGPELDEYLESFAKCGGGSQGTESHELVAYYLVERVGTSTAQNVYCFFVTDEAGCDTVDAAHVEAWLGTTRRRELAKTCAVFDRLSQRMQVFCVLCATGCYAPAPIQAWWEGTLGREHLLPLDDARRCVDVMLGTLATLVGQQDQFTADLRSRQLGTKFGAQNVAAVQQSICMVGSGTPSAPYQLPDAPVPKLLASALLSTQHPRKP